MVAASGGLSDLHPAIPCEADAREAEDEHRPGGGLGDRRGGDVASKRGVAVCISCQLNFITDRIPSRIYERWRHAHN